MDGPSCSLWDMSLKCIWSCGAMYVLMVAGKNGDCTNNGCRLNSTEKDQGDKPDRVFTLMPVGGVLQGFGGEESSTQRVWLRTTKRPAGVEGWHKQAVAVGVRNVPWDWTASCKEMPLAVQSIQRPKTVTLF